MIYRVTIGSTELATANPAAAEQLVSSLVHFGPVTVILQTLTEEENSYHERFHKIEDWNERKAFDYDWRKWMEEMKREKAHAEGTPVLNPAGSPTAG